MGVSTAAMVARRRFGEALKAARLKSIADDGRPIKQITVANALGRKTIDRYSRLERGEAWPEDDEWTTIARVLGMGLEDRVRLETMLVEGRRIGTAWWNEYEDEFAESLIEFIAYEDSAPKITTCAGNVVPGLLQTPGYGRSLTSVLAKTTMTSHLVERAIELRTNRRRIFEKENPPAVEAIVGEAALRQRIGGSDDMVVQLDSLVEDAEERGVTFRVIPFEAVATLTYMFHLFEFSEKHETPIVAFDAMTGMSFRKNPKEVRGLVGFVASLRELSLSSVDSLEMIKTIRKELSRD